MRGALGGSSLIIPLCVLLVGGGSTACGGGDKATGPTPLGCADARWGFAGGGPPLIAFTLGCSSLEVSYIGLGSDQFGRTLGYTYTYGCQDGSERQTGSVLNIQYNSLGQALGWDYTVNGQSCGHVTRTP